MAEKLSITIALEGAEEIKRQLADVGKAGEQAFKDINKAAAEVGGFNKLDPSVITEKMANAGVTGKEAFDKINTAVKQAGRMETLVNALTKVENGLSGVQSAASALDAVLFKGLVRSLTMVARLLPAAFAAGVVASISNTAKAIGELDAAAINLGTSIGEVAKAQEIFKQIGLSSSEAAKGVADLFEKMNLEAVKRAIEEIDTKFLTFSGLDALTRAAQGFGEAANLARKKLEEIGKLDTRLTPAAQAIKDIKESSKGFSDQLLAMLSVFEKMGNTAERNRLIFQNFGQEFGTAIIQMLNAGISINSIAQALANLVPPTQEAANAATRLSVEWQKFKNFISGGFTVSVEGLDAVAASLAQIRTAMEAVSAAMASSGLSNVFANTAREIQTVINLLGTLGQIGFQAMKFIEAGAVEAWNTIIGWINKAIEAVQQFFGMGGGQAQGAGAQGMARGGIMGGRGSGTSDSNLAWLSRGEHIMPARAVRQPGVLQLLEALRRSGGNLRGVLDRMGHFAMGGLVGAPAFAGGGVNGMNHVTIAFPGLPAIGGLRASSAVVDELRRAAALAQVRSGGRKPSRYS